MSTLPAGSLARHLRRLLPQAGLAALTDRQLLERFAAVRDEAAFAALVERHGRLVLGVCRRTLGDAHEAEDVFQATFLVLARKADSLRRPDAVAGFLHGVAARLARKARVQRQRRRLPEAREVPASQDVPAAVERDEVCRVVDEELRRLPAHYRTPLMLCYLEGKSRQEAAAALGCSEGAVKGKLERGRELLRARLVRRGVAAVPAALAALEQPAGAAPAAWTAAAVRAATAGGRLTGAAAALADGLLRGMAAVKLKVAGGLLLLCVLGLGVGLTAWSGDVPPRRDRPGEPLPAGAVARLGDVQLHEDAPVLFVGFARKGQLITAQQAGHTYYCATCHEREPFVPPGVEPLFAKGAFRVWDLEHGRELNRFGLEAKVFAPANVQADGGRVAPIAYPAVNIALAPDGQTLAVVGDEVGGNGVLRLWDVATGRKTRELFLWIPKERGTVLRTSASTGCAALAFTPDGKHVGICDWLGTIRVLDPVTGREVRTVEAEDDCWGNWGDALAFSRDGALLAMSCTKGREKKASSLLRVIDADNKERWRACDKAFGSPALAFAPEARSLAYATAEGRVRLADAATGKEIRTLGDPERTRCLAALAFSPDGRTLATRGYDRAIRLWDVASGRELRQLTPSLRSLQAGSTTTYFGPALLSPASTLAFSPDGKFLAAADPAGRARLWEAATGKEMHAGHAGAVTAIDFSTGGAIRSLGADQTVRQWRPAGGEQTARFRLPVSAPDVALSPAGNLAAFSVAPETVVLWDVEAGREVRRIDASEGAPHCVGSALPHSLAFSPNGKLLARRSLDGTVRLWDAVSGRRLRTLPAPQPPATRVKYPDGRAGLAFAPDGAVLAVLGPPEEQGSQTSIFLWGVPDVWLGRLDTVESGIASMAFAPDSRVLALGHDNGTVSLWELATGERRATLRSDARRPVTVLAFAPDGKVLASAQDQKIHLWDARSGRELESRRGHSLDLVSAAFSPDGRTLVSGSRDSTALVWDVVGLRPEPKLITLTERELDAYWDDLAGKADLALAAMNRLVAAPRQTAVFLRDHLHPVPDAKHVARLIADLEDSEFAVRERASAELEKLGELAGPAVRRALEANPPPESRRRLGALREKLDARIQSPETLRAMRAVELLEQMNSPEARALLERLAGGASGATLTRQARAALDRLPHETPP